MNNKLRLSSSLLAAIVAANTATAAEVYMSPDAKKTKHDSSVFLPDPSYPDRPYDFQSQLDIYGNKRKNTNPRVPVELGRPIYDTGLFSKPSYALGKKNPINHQFLVYGDIRFAAGINDNGTFEQGTIATKATIDFDWKFTATERIHAIMTPFDKDGVITRYDFGDEDEGAREGNDSEFDPKLDALFFEGDLGALVSGFSDSYTSWDMPIAFGLMPLFMQNGVWMNDAIGGIAFTIPAQNSSALNISNYDITFFAAVDDIESGLDVDEDDVSLGGVTGFFELWEGYLEMGYGYVHDGSDLGDQSYHNLGISFTRRYGGWVSNSVRVVGNFGQDRDDEDATKTADGAAFFVESSLITSLPSTLVPYFNMFYTIDTPKALAKDAATGGILSNVGILFETDGVTGQQTLDSSGADSFGAALGIEYLFALNQQLVIEVAGVVANDDEEVLIQNGDQFGVGLRYQRKLSERWLFRTDAMYATFDEQEGEEEIEDISSFRIELRAKL